MITWPQAIDRIDHATPRDLPLDKKFFTRLERTPILIAGNSGAGKTRLWSFLTGKPRPNRRSRETDTGYMPAPGRRRFALTTIPGEIATPRFLAVQDYFGTENRVEGVVFVASNGYDHIWFDSADTVAASLRLDGAYDLQGLRNHNLREERNNFGDICREVIRHHQMADEEDNRPKWLLTVVNKADLYWNNRPEAEDIYLPGCGSEFDAIAQRLLERLGTGALNYYVTPLATEVGPYDFHSSYGSIGAGCHLTDDQRDAAVRCLVDNIGVLCNV